LPAGSDTRASKDVRRRLAQLQAELTAWEGRCGTQLEAISLLQDPTGRRSLARSSVQVGGAARG